MEETLQQFLTGSQTLSLDLQMAGQFRINAHPWLARRKSSWQVAHRTPLITIPGRVLGIKAIWCSGTTPAGDAGC